MTKKILSALKFGISNQLVNPDAINVISKLQQNGYDGYIVGGGVRDLLLGKKPKDFDIVTDATPEIVRKIFKRNGVIIGRRFKIVHVVFDHLNFDRMYNNRPAVEKHIMEISTYRSLKINNHTLNQYGKIMVDNNYGNQKDDSTRRDFTINAMYYDPIKEIIIDYHNGMKDLQNKSLTIIGDPQKRYIEDPVRILRAIRLSIKLGLTIADNTSSCFDEAKKLLVHEHLGRMYEEMLKILLSGYAFDCIKKLKDFGLPKRVFVLFDKLFFGENQDEIALKILEKTDERLRENATISTMFILAGLLWSTVNKTWQKKIFDGESPRLALSDAIYNCKQYAVDAGINRGAYSAMTDVWLLQYDFENPTLKKLDRTFNNGRFRQALHLYNLRSELGEVDHKLNTWWNAYIEETENENKLQMLDQLTQIIGERSSSKPKRRRKKAIPDHTRLDKQR